MDELTLDYIYMIEVRHSYRIKGFASPAVKYALYVGHTINLDRRIKAHQSSRTGRGEMNEFHKMMRVCGYKVYLLDVRVGRCEAGLETRWISFVHDWCNNWLYDCYNKAQIVSNYDRTYCEERWKYRTLYKEVDRHEIVLRGTERNYWQSMRERQNG